LIIYKVNQFFHHLPNAVSLRQITSRTFSLSESLRGLCSKIESRYIRLKHGDKQEIRDLYTRQLYRMDEKHPYRKNDEIFYACLRGVDDFGRLALEDEEGHISHYGLKEVEFLP
jgi:BirA family transcriptional regulator, biotin operon repressor / biotin---[acetyl-CoA-carboxylase] ligase